MLPTTRPFGKPELVLALPPEPVRWLLPGLLPADDLVVLDGPSGIGKTLFAAALAARVSNTPFRDPKDAPRVAWGSDLLTFSQSAQPALHRHAFADGLVLRFDISRAAIEKQPAVDLMWDFLAHLEAVCKQLKPRLLVLDGLEDQLPFIETLKPADVCRFYRNLRALAQMQNTCLLLLRRGTLTGPRRHAADAAPVILTLAWHPDDLSRRLLTVAKNKLGPTGAQFELTIDATAHATWTELAGDAHARPVHAASPVTWQRKKPGPASLAPQAAARLAELLAQTPAPLASRDAWDQLRAEGYPESSIRTALRLSQIKVFKRGKDWWYVLKQEGDRSQETEDRQEGVRSQESGDRVRQEGVRSQETGVRISPGATAPRRLKQEDRSQQTEVRMGAGSAAPLREAMPSKPSTTSEEQPMREAPPAAILARSVSKGPAASERSAAERCEPAWDTTRISPTSQDEIPTIIPSAITADISPTSHDPHPELHVSPLILPTDHRPLTTTS